MNVLVVDDEPDVKLLFEQQFRKQRKSGEMTFTFAFSAEEALALLERGESAEFVLILSDINLPGASGLDLLKAIKEAKPAIKVIMITAYGDDANYQAAISMGADGFVTKPIDFAALKTMMFGT